jgi:hypothetical protein
MARVLAPGGKMILTDVILTKPLPQRVRDALQSIGLGYLCQATTEDFRSWMMSAGLTNVDVRDLTPLVRSVWENRSESDINPSHQVGYSYLLDHPQVGLGKGIFYIYVCGEKLLARP